jgi:hypothetical protein
MILKRKHLRSLALGILLLAIGSHDIAIAQSHASDDIPKIILSGFEAYKAEGAEAAISAWIKGSPLEGSKDALSQANILRQIQDFYGPYKSFDLIRSRNLTPNCRIIYVVMNYDKGPLFAKFTVYQSTQGWVLTNFLFNTKDEVVLPSTL